MPATHQFVRDEPYYTTGPQQGRPADGTFAKGTLCTPLDARVGPYVQVQAEGGPTGYVAEDSIAPVAAATLISYFIESDTDGKLKAGAKQACNFWNRFVSPGRSIVVRLGTFNQQSNTIARAYKPYQNGGVLYGRVEFNKKYLSGFSPNQTAGTIAHEIGHTLGFGWEVWLSSFEHTTGLFLPSAIEIVPGLAKMEVERDGGPGTELSHWDEAKFGRELMTGYKDSAEIVLPITISVMTLLGHTVLQPLAEERKLEDLLQETAEVLFSRQGDIAAIKLDHFVETELWDTVSSSS